MIGNVASERVAEKGGYTFVKELADYVHPVDSVRRNVKWWARVAPPVQA